MPRFVLLALSVLIGSGCSALSDGVRQLPRSVTSIKRHPIETDQPLPPPLEQLTDIETISAATQDSRRSPDELLIGSALKSKVSQQPSELLQRWDEPGDTTASAHPTKSPLSTNGVIAPACLNQFNAMLTPLPENLAGDCQFDGTEPDVVAQSKPIPLRATDTAAEPLGVAVSAPTNAQLNPAGLQVYPSAYVSVPDPPADGAHDAEFVEGDDVLLDVLSMTNPNTQKRLRVNRVCLCREVHGFGQVVPFANASFEPRQPVLIYCEVDDYQTQSETGPDGDSFRTSFSGDYVITDPSGNIVAQREYGSVDDISQSRREDFYLVFPATLPELAPGNYRLYLIIQDELSRELVAHGEPLQFSIAGSASAAR